MDKFEFTPKKGFEDASAYPDPISESETREQLMRPSKQIQEYINGELMNTIVTLTGATGSSEAIAQMQTILNTYKQNVDDYISGVKTVYISKSNYDALTDIEKNNGNLYFIGD